MRACVCVACRHAYAWRGAPEDGARPPREAAALLVPSRAAVREHVAAAAVGISAAAFAEASGSRGAGECRRERAALCGVVAAVVERVYRQKVERRLGRFVGAGGRVAEAAWSRGVWFGRRVRHLVGCGWRRDGPQRERWWPHAEASDRVRARWLRPLWQRRQRARLHEPRQLVPVRDHDRPGCVALVAHQRRALAKVDRHRRSHRWRLVGEQASVDRLLELVLQEATVAVASSSV